MKAAYIILGAALALSAAAVAGPESTDRVRTAAAARRTKAARPKGHETGRTEDRMDELRIGSQRRFATATVTPA